jgi:PPOX class probable FMN-dependent enzyme
LVVTEAAGDHVISRIEDLETLYGEVDARSIDKEIGYLHPHYAALIKAAPFAALATCGPEGLDVSPRGDEPGFVEVLDKTRLALPDRRGNNRIDSLRNVIADPRVALLFLVPGIGETLRVNGRAEISVAPDLLERFSVNGKPPRSVLLIRVETVFFQCSRAVVRADLWNPDKRLPRSALPSTGTILADLSRTSSEAEPYDAALPERVKATLY